MNVAVIRSHVELTPLEFLHAVDLNDTLPLAVRMRAAIEAAPYVHPKLAAHSLGTDGGVTTARR
jgi:hypothetical protein